MMTVSSLFRTGTVLLVAIATANFAVAQEGEGCGIIPSETIAPDYVPPPVRVGGVPGCTIGESTGCYCHTELDGEIDNNEWLWQCEDDTLFGPSGNKTCPEALPSGECDVSIHPTGGPGDPGCGYSDCADEATFSAICGCIDLSMFGQDGGHTWTCIESTCDCPEESATGTTASPEGSATTTTPTSGAFQAASAILVSCGFVVVLVALSSV